MDTSFHGRSVPVVLVDDEPSDSSTKPSRNTVYTLLRGQLLQFFVRRTRNRTLAQDLTQETLLKVMAAGQLESTRKPASYVFTVALNLLRDQQRGQTRRGAHLSLDSAAISRQPGLVNALSPERTVLDREALERVVRVLSQLEPRTREIFFLFRLEGRRQKEIADLYGMGVSTVEKHILRATAHLAQHMKRHGIS